MSYNLFLLYLLEFQISTAFLKSQKCEYSGHQAHIYAQKQAKNPLFFFSENKDFHWLNAVRKYIRLHYR